MSRLRFCLAVMLSCFPRKRPVANIPSKRLLSWKGFCLRQNPIYLGRSNGTRYSVQVRLTRISLRGIYVGMLKEFKQFLLRGNVADLAVRVVVGAAFGTVVTALVKDLLTPFIAAIAKVPDFSNLAFTINGSTFIYGDFINAVISFALVAG